MAQNDYLILDPHLVVILSSDQPKLYARYSYREREVGESSIDYIPLNEAAAEILLRCDGGTTLHEIIDQIGPLIDDQQGEPEEIVRRFINESLRRGYIAITPDKERRTDTCVGNRNLAAPLSVFLEVTKRCPLKCLHCYNRSGLARAEELSCEDVCNVLNTLQTIGVQKLMITGGEPFVREDMLDILNYAAPRFAGIMIGTNGFLLGEKEANQIQKLNSEFGNIAVQVSLDGMRQSHDYIRGVPGSFSNASYALKLLNECSVPTIVAMTVNAFNYHDIEALTKHAISLGARQLSISLTVSQGRAKDNDLTQHIDYKSVLSEIRRMRELYGREGMFIYLDEDTTVQFLSDSDVPYCGAGREIVAIRENGDVSPCVSYYCTFGNILTSDISEIFSKEQTGLFADVPRPSKEVCGNCDLLDNNCKQCNARALDSGVEACAWRPLFNSIVGDKVDLY